MRQIPELRLARQLLNVDHQAVARAMPPGITLVEVVRFTVYDFHAIPARGERWWQEARYLAFVVAAEEPDTVQMVDLGAAEPIDRLIGAFRTALIAEGLRKKGRDSGSPQQRPGNGALAPPQSLRDGRQLRAQVFDPVVNALGGATHLLLSPDGDLTRLPFEILPQDDGHLLMDEGYRITYLSSGRDVLRFAAASSGEPGAPVVVANPNFDLGATVAVATTTQGSSSEPITLTKGLRRSQDLGRSSSHFSPLPGSQIEGERIAAKLNVPPWLVDDALEARLKVCQSPRILHLSTHGFFLEDQDYDRNKFFQHHFMPRAGTESGGELLALPGMENPMLRSGLALAGANTGLRKEPLPPEAEDGLLTAEDVSGLNLLNTDLVVLSACNTGLGERRTGEGVMGLRRAFVIAGAKTLVMSLWSVSDLSTAILMERFYLHLLDHHLPRDQALHQAQIATRDITIQQLQQEGWLSPETIERFVAGQQNSKKQKEMRQWLEHLAQQPADHQPFTLPYYWGAFICQGDPSPLVH